MKQASAESVGAVHNYVYSNGEPHKSLTKKIALIIIFSIVLILSISTAVYAEDSDYNAVEEIYGETQTASATSSYDYRSILLNIKIKNQGNTNLCWAYTVTSVFELSLQKQHNIQYTQSLQHLQDFAIYEYSIFAQSGSTIQTPMDYYMKNIGPRADSNSYVTSNYKETLLKSADYMVNDIDVLNGKTVKEIKQYIYENGPVYSALYMDIKELNLSTGAYNFPKATKKKGGINHAITIVGWDDNYKKDNFISKPKNNGAWIILNSGGTQFGNGDMGTAWAKNNPNDAGYFYVSYEDVFINTIGVLGFRNISKVDYDFSYDCYNKFDAQNDDTYKELEARIESIIKNKTVKAKVNLKEGQWVAANVLERFPETPEQLTKVGFFVGGAYSKNYSVDCDIYINPVDDDIKKLQLVKSLKNVNAGYHVINLEKSLKLQGEKFIIAVVYKSRNGEKLWFAYNNVYDSKAGYVLEGNSIQTLTQTYANSYTIRAYTKTTNKSKAKQSASIQSVKFSKVTSSQNSYIGQYIVDVKLNRLKADDCMVSIEEDPDSNHTTIEDPIETKNGFSVKINILPTLKPGKYTIVVENFEGVILAKKKINFTYKGVNSSRKSGSNQPMQKASQLSALQISKQVITRADINQEATSYRNTELSKEEFLKQEDLFYYATGSDLIYEKAPEGEDTSKDARVQVKDLIDEQINQLTASKLRLKNEEINEQTKEDPLATNPYGETDTVVATSNTIAKYRTSGRVTLTPQEIYILAHAKDLNWDACKVQQALLHLKGESLQAEKQESEIVVNNLVAESQKYAEYIQKLQAFKKANNNKIIADKTNYSNITVGYDGETNQILTGPYTVDYVYESFEVNPKGESEIIEEKSSKITYGEIVDLIIYAESNKTTEIRNWEFVFPNRTVAEQITYEYPLPGEEFWIKFSNALNPDITTVG